MTSLYRKFGGVYSYVTDKAKVWCAHCASWKPEEKCAIIDNFIKCEDCIIKDNQMQQRSQLEAKERQDEIQT